MWLLLMQESLESHPVFDVKNAFEFSTPEFNIIPRMQFIDLASSLTAVL